MEQRQAIAKYFGFIPPAKREQAAERSRQRRISH
jgi:hypothetical protein